MQRALACVVALSVISACSGASPTRPSPDTNSFGVMAPTTGATNFSGCLSGTHENSCFSATRLHLREVAGADAVGAPISLGATVAGSTVSLTWTQPFLSAVTAYIIEAGSAPGVANLANFSTGNTQTSYSAAGVGAGTYYVRVRAIGTVGEVGPASNEVVVVVGPSGPAPCGALGAPSGLSIVSAFGSTVSLAWAPAAGNPTSYVVEAGSAPGLANLANSDLGSPALGLTATNVGIGTYYVRVRAKNACGVSGPSNEVVFTLGFATPNPTPNPTPSPTPSPTPAPFSRSGVGNFVFDLPRGIFRLRITGTYNALISNFIVYVGGRLVVNDIIGTYTGYQPTSDGVYQTNGGTVEIRSSTGVAWTVSEFR